MSKADIQAALAEYIIKRIQDDSGVAIQLLPKAEFLSAEKRIQREASNAVEALTATAEYELNLPYLAMVDGEPLNITFIIKRSTLQEISRKLSR